MSREEKKQAIERIAEKFTALPEEGKSLITGYMLGVEEERKKWQKQKADTGRVA